MTEELNKLVDELVPVTEQGALFANRPEIPAGAKLASSGKYYAQYYENSILKGSEIEQQASELRGPFNPRDPSLAIQHEQPKHRLICYLKAQGLSYKEIGERVQAAPGWVAQVVRQPWAKVLIYEEIQKAGAAVLEKLLESSALDSIHKLIDIRDDIAAPKHVQLQAANSLLDRYLGKPTQKVETEITHKSVNVEEIQRELEQTSAELKRLGISPGGAN